MYHKANINIEQLHKEINDSPLIPLKLKPRGMIISALLKLFVAIGLYKRLCEAGLVRGWFEIFERYWRNELGGRPLRLHDFWYLQGYYRANFQDVSVSDNASESEFLAAWQRPETMAILFSAIYNYALMPFYYWHFKRYLKSSDVILEYGCGIAPVASSMILDGYKNQFVIADIRQINFHYAKYLLGNRVQTFDILPYEKVTIPVKIDVACLLVVMEHLPNPLEVVTAITSALNPGGRIIFDYILGDGGGA
jgi:2-polyprenyl-3-methyl-5-hydroxy-6-metoxy-1,4-benzoquinol methylase